MAPLESFLSSIRSWNHMTYSFESLKEELVTEDSFKIFFKKNKF